MLSWHDRYVLRGFLKASFYLGPVSAILLAMAAAPAVRWIDEQTRWKILDAGLEGARSVVGNLPAALLSLIVFFLGTVLIAVQLASSQYSQRIIARFSKRKM